MSEEPLVHLPFERWSELQNAFKADWPRGISGYVVLETQKKIIEKGYDYGFTVYCPFGEVKNGMVAVNVKDTIYEVIIQCPQDDTEKLEEALKGTHLINWQNYVVVPFAPLHVINCLKRAVGEITKLDFLTSDTFIYDKPTTFENIELPPGITFGPVSSEHLELVVTSWPYRYASAPWYFQLLMNMKRGYGLFEDNKLFAWVFLNESGALLHLYTIEDYRRKGYAELVLKLFSNMLIKEGEPVIAFCVKGNANAYKLYEKLKFVNSHPIAWCYVNNHLRLV